MEEFQKIEDELNDAYERGDLDKIRNMLSEKWYIVESATGISTREEFLSAIESGRLVQTKMKKQLVKVTLLDDVAVVISRGRNEGIYNNTSYNTEQWVTNVFEHRDGVWRCVMTQETPVSDC